MTNKSPENLVSLMKKVVADKTGYPEEMLSPEMDLSSDLGVDSIKRVEILSAFTDELNDEIDYEIEDLEALQTLGDVTDYFSKKVK